MRFLLLPFLLFALSGWSSPVDSLVTEEWFEQALVHYDNGNTDSFELMYEKVATALKRQDDLKGWIVKHKNLGKKALLDGNDPNASVVFLEKAFEENLFRTPASEEEWEELGYLYIFAGYVQNNEFESFEKAKDFYNYARKILVEKLGIKDYYVARYLFIPLSVIHTIHGDYNAAETLLKQCVQIGLDEDAPEFAARALSDLSVVYLDLGRHQEVVRTCNQGLALGIEDEVALGLLNSNLAKGQLELGRIEESLRSINNSDRYFNILFEAGWGKTALGWLFVNKSIEGTIYSKLGNFYLANVSLLEAENYLDNINDNYYDRDYGKLYLSWGGIKLEEKKYEEALSLFHKSLQSMLPSFKAENPTINPSIDLLYPENTLMDALLGKAKAFDHLYKTQKNIHFLEVALECHELIFEVEKLLRESYYYEHSKLFNLEESRERCEHAVSVCMKLAKEKDKGFYQQKAFEFAERSKSVLLLETFMNNNALEESGLSEQLLAEEKFFRQKTGDLEEDIYRMEADSLPDEAEIQKRREALYNLKKQYADWQKDIQKDYSQYYNNRYNEKVLSINEAQSSLVGKNQTLLEYFVGDSMIYLFVINKQGYEVIEIPKPQSFESDVLSFLESIQGYIHSDQPQEYCDNFTRLGYELYQLLLGKAEKKGLLKENVTVIPSGIMSFVQFDALLTKNPKEHCQFNQYPYALYDHTFSYGYSVTLQYYLGALPDRNYRNQLFGIAPEFSGNNGWGALSANVTLLQSLEKVWEGVFAINNEATINKLNEALRQGSFEIIHFSTHAQANSGQGNFSFIVFSDANGDYDSLYVKDIYQLKILSEMVVLGACETAKGTLYNGEGVISLARAFMQSGSKSVITTMWSVYDGTNKNVMLDFYDNLKNGMTKSQALRQAKINQTRLDSRSAHPVFWAAYVPYGQMDPIRNGKSPWFYAIIVILAIAGIWGFWRWQRSKSEKIKKVV